MALGRLLSTASEMASSFASAVGNLATAPGGRHSWSSDDRTHLEVRGLHRADSADLARTVRHRLHARDGVENVQVNATLGRVVVHHDRELVGVEELVRVVEEVEEENDLAHAETAPASAHHPGNPGPILREIGALGVSVGGLGYAAVTSLSPVRLLPSAIPVTLSLVESVPWMRSALQERLGTQITDTALATTGTVSQVLARNPMALAVTIYQRLCTSREVVARHQAWHRWERSVATHSDGHHADPIEVPARPCALPGGPVERMSNVSGTLALIGYGMTWGLTSSSQRAVAMMQAGIPRAGKAGREAFAAQLSTTMSGRASLIFDPDVLRRLDRVDTVVLDARASQAAELVAVARATGHAVITELDTDLEHRLPVNSAAESEIADTVRELQAEGAVVAVVSTLDRSALSAADVGIGVAESSDTLPWGAHVVCFDLADAHTLLAAVAQARTTSRHSTRLTVVGSWLGGLFGSLGPAYGASYRASMPVNTAALLALGLGTWSGMQATGHLAPTSDHTPQRPSSPPSPDGRLEEPSRRGSTRRLRPVTAHSGV